MKWRGSALFFELCTIKLWYLHFNHMKAFSSSFFIFLFLLSSLFIKDVQAQFIKGFGLNAGATFSKQKWEGSNPDFVSQKKYKAGLNTAGFIEYIDHKYYRMVSELQFNMKGARESIDSLKGFKYRANYLSFNNFFKIRQELYDVTPYALAGPRLEFLLNSNIPSMRKLHLSASAGIGMEFLYTRPWIIFGEIQYNPDAMKALKITDFGIRQNAWEIRVGVKYERKRKADCPRPSGGRNF